MELSDSRLLVVPDSSSVCMPVSSLNCFFAWDMWKKSCSEFGPSFLIIHSTVDSYGFGLHLTGSSPDNWGRDLGKAVTTVSCLPDVSCWSLLTGLLLENFMSDESVLSVEIWRLNLNFDGSCKGKGFRTGAVCGSRMHETSSSSAEIDV